jgi:hypothetical protein
VKVLLVEMLSYSKTIQKQDLAVKHLLSLVLDTATSSFRLQQISSLSKQKLPREDYLFSSWPDISSYDTEKGKNGACVVTSLYQLARGDLDTAGQLLEKIANDAAGIHQDDLGRFNIPLLREMIDITEHQPSKASIICDLRSIYYHQTTWHIVVGNCGNQTRSASLLPSARLFLLLPFLFYLPPLGFLLLFSVWICVLEPKAERDPRLAQSRSVTKAIRETARIFCLVSELVSVRHAFQS